MQHSTTEEEAHKKCKEACQKNKALFMWQHSTADTTCIMQMWYNLAELYDSGKHHNKDRALREWQPSITDSTLYDRGRAILQSEAPR